MTVMPTPVLHPSPALNPVGAGVSANSGVSHVHDAVSRVDPRMKEAAAQFEAVFLRQLLSCLERTTTTGAPAAGGSIYGSMVVNTMADALSKAGGIGLADMLTRALAGQEGISGPHSAPTKPGPTTHADAPGETVPRTGLAGPEAMATPAPLTGPHQQVRRR